ncbi:complement factor B-like [Hypanus sabinus]|uniref:complement factor B-like n=1 Tax=Hypanus sabinus TaxID=79690 RepID=UPI0028C46093|nr:complement factor B-like [Hypanus sabinus]
MGSRSVSEASILLLLSVIVRGELPDGVSCDPGVTITGGTVTLSNGVAVGSVLRYICPSGFYPDPTASRTCQSSGQWSTMRDSRRRTVRKAACRGFRCPPPTVEHGSFFPRRGSHVPGDMVSIVCDDGYQLRGSSSRSCLPNGRWNGSTTACDDGMGTCPNPGIPPGSIKTGKNYDVGDKVQYRCQGDLVLIGSSVRVCLETGVWTGSEPSCQHKFSFDLPEEVAMHFSSSFSLLLSESKEEPVKSDQLGRKIILRQNEKLYIYVLLDVSGSITRDDFQTAKEILSKFIDMIGRFEVSVRYAILLFGSQTRDVVHIGAEESSDSREVSDIVSAMKYDDYVVKRNLGTNVTGAFKTVYGMMSYARTNMKDRLDEWMQIRHVILVFTDGRANVDGVPTGIMNRIRSFLEIENSREDYLDVYVFGLGQNADKEQINSIASKKANERHAFFLANETHLNTVFNHLLDLSSVGSLCGFANKSLNATDEQRSYPWFTDILHNQKPNSRCSGSIVAPQWILTAAHCFGNLANEDPSDLSIRVGSSVKIIVKIEQIIVHPQYNLTGKIAKKIREFYDYDVALIKLATELKFTTDIRPICLPCTEETSVALRRSRTGTSCSDHESDLLPMSGIVEAKFVRTKNYLQTLENVKIKMAGQARAECERDALRAGVYVNVSDVKEVVTDRFLCTGGNQEAVSCKGDSGGPLSVGKLYRYIQVGVVSWGVKDVCMASSPPVDARDFHLNVFRVVDWLREHLAGSVRFLQPRPGP